MHAPRDPGTFDGFFRAATGHPPRAYLAPAAADGLPAEIAVPVGSGNTEVILAWLWRRSHGPAAVRSGTPRRLVWALPPGALLEPAAAEVRGWLGRLGLAGEVALHVVTGARAENAGNWREDMHLPAIIIGTTDMLVSKALNRGYGQSRAMYPIDFALTVNGAHWVIDEARLCPQSSVTLRRLTGLAEQAGTAEPAGLTLLSSLPPAVTFRRLAAEPGDYRAIAASALDGHAPGTRTLIVLNTVRAAQQVYQQLRGFPEFAGPGGVTLLHPRFRGTERGERVAAIPGPAENQAAGDQVIVATSVVEAGIGDLGAALLITEAAPWASLALRARHRDRAGGPGEVLWVPPPRAAPRGREHLHADPARDGDHRTVIQPGEFAALFDTGAGDDTDIAPYLRDAGDLDAEVAWATWTPGADGAPDPAVRYPAPEYRCRVPIGDTVALAQDRTVWRRDPETGRWIPVPRSPRSRPRPGELLLVNAADGGYDPETGFNPGAREPVAGSPELLTPQEAASAPADGPPRRWQSLDEHSAQVRDQAAALLAALAPRISPEAAAAAIVAGYLHDLGKAHPVWQDALCALAGDGERAEVAAGRPWAKSGTTAKPGRLEFAGGQSFRHELASLLLLDGPLRGLLAASPDPDLTRYLVLAHHGLLRVRVNDPDGFEQGAVSDIPPVLGQLATMLTVDLAQFLPPVQPDGLPHGESAWTRTVLSLVGKYGPVTLAYLETVVRMADWRASGGWELARPGN